MSLAESYAIAAVHGVLLPATEAARRPYVPKGSQTHISITSTVKSGQQLGVARRIHTSGGGSSDTASDDVAPRVALTGLVATCPRDGTRLIRHTAATDSSTDDALWESLPLPSGQRIGCIQLTSESRAAMLQAGPNAAAFPSPALHVADVVGNVYGVTLPDASVAASLSDEAPAKRARQEPDDGSSFWRLIAPASTCDADSCSYGARGWCGLATLPSQQLACCREFFFDIRVLDTAAGAVVQEYGTFHPPTGLCTCAGIPHGIVVAEGPVATVYDLRCGGAALTMGKDAKSSHPFVESRLTSPTAGVADVCATGNEYEVAVALGRSLCVHDVRKWNRVGITTNVLKYEIGSIAPFAAGKAIIAAGIDAEMRVVPLQKSNAVSANANRNNEQKSGGEKGEEPAAMSFRNRIDSVVSCRSTWHGGWAESVDGVCATGVSVDHEVFLAY